MTLVEAISTCPDCLRGSLPAQAGSLDDLIDLADDHLSRYVEGQAGAINDEEDAQDVRGWRRLLFSDIRESR